MDGLMSFVWVLMILSNSLAWLSVWATGVQKWGFWVSPLESASFFHSNVRTQVMSSVTIFIRNNNQKNGFKGWVKVSVWVKIFMNLVSCTDTCKNGSVDVSELYNYKPRLIQTCNNPCWTGLWQVSMMFGLSHRSLPSLSFSVPSFLLRIEPRVSCMPTVCSMVQKQLCIYFSLWQSLVKLLSCSGWFCNFPSWVFWVAADTTPHSPVWSLLILRIYSERCLMDNMAT